LRGDSCCDWLSTRLDLLPFCTIPRRISGRPRNNSPRSWKGYWKVGNSPISPWFQQS
jgi:hypothetical protein